MHLCSSSRCVRVSATPKFDASESAPEPISGLTRHAGIAPRMCLALYMLHRPSTCRGKTWPQRCSVRLPATGKGQGQGQGQGKG